MEALKDGESTSEGTGIIISTLFAMDRDLNWLLALIMYSMREWECGSTTASTQIRGFTCVERRYVMRSNSPSGGMKDIVRSFSKRARRTHWWNFMSSSSTAFPLGCDLPVASNISLSFNPNFSSGMPLRKLFILIAPTISEFSTVPLLETRRLSFSTTSRNISFFRCFMPSDRQLTALVTAIGGRAATSCLFDSWVMYSRRILESILWGYPKSFVSSSNSYMITKLSRMDSSSNSPK
mmetsp:Transcript_60987/g.83744  ORF Transcript_60987/g.83744 Transcript_60987/m.83744 type:complete len:237 (+) Transcript_60987:737-1447(+)